MRPWIAVCVAVLAVTAGCVTTLSGPDPSEAPSTTPGPGAFAGETRTVTVDWVEDGDTIWFVNESGADVGIRLVGIDTPETQGLNYPAEYQRIPDDAAGRDYLDRWGVTVRGYLAERLEGETVRIAFDPNLPRRDYYSRLVAYVYHDGDLVNLELVERGYARVYPVGFEMRETFVQAQQEAMRERRGLWNYSEGSGGG